MAKMNVTENDFDAFLQATESLMAMSGGLAVSHTRNGMPTSLAVEI